MPTPRRSARAALRSGRRRPAVEDSRRRAPLLGPKPPSCRVLHSAMSAQPSLSPALACNAQSGDLRCLFEWSYLASNPQVFASLIAVVGTLFVGGLTLFGVWQTLRFNRKKMAADLAAAEKAAAASRDFSARQATESHLMELRKALYATLVEEHQNAIAALFSMSSLTLLEAAETAKRLAPYTSAVQKTLIISGAQTSKLAREVHSKVMEAIFDLVPQVAILAPFKEKLAKANADLNEKVAAMSAIVERASRTPKTDANAMQDLAASAQAAQSGYEAALAMRNQLADDHSKSFAQFQSAATQHAQDFSMKHSEFLSLARSELGIVGDPIEPHEVQENFERAQRALQRLKRAMGLAE